MTTATRKSARKVSVNVSTSSEQNGKSTNGSLPVAGANEHASHGVLTELNRDARQLLSGISGGSGGLVQLLVDEFRISVEVATSVVAGAGIENNPQLLLILEALLARIRRTRGGPLSSQAMLEAIEDDTMGIFPLYLPKYRNDPLLGQLEWPHDNGSYTLRVGGKVRELKLPQGFDIHMHRQDIPALYRKYGKEVVYPFGATVTVPPRTLLLVETMERLLFRQARGLCGTFSGVSLGGRCGLGVHLTASFLQNGHGDGVFPTDPDLFACFENARNTKLRRPLRRLFDVDYERMKQIGRTIEGRTVTGEVFSVWPDRCAKFTVGKRFCQFRADTQVEGRGGYGEAYLHGLFTRSPGLEGRTFAETHADHGPTGRL